MKRAAPRLGKKVDQKLALAGTAPVFAAYDIGVLLVEATKGDVYAPHRWIYSPHIRGCPAVSER